MQSTPASLQRNQVWNISLKKIKKASFEIDTLFKSFAMYINKHTQHNMPTIYIIIVLVMYRNHFCVIQRCMSGERERERESERRAKNLKRGKSPDVKNILHTCVVKNFFIFFLCAPFRLLKSSHAHHRNAIGVNKIFRSPSLNETFLLYSCVFVAEKSLCTFPLISIIIERAAAAQQRTIVPMTSFRASIFSSSNAKECTRVVGDAFVNNSRKLWKANINNEIDLMEENKKNKYRMQRGN